MIRLGNDFGVSAHHAQSDRRTVRRNMLVRMAMAVEAPFHVKGRSSPGQWHFSDVTMASLTVDAFGRMYSMMEIDEIGKVMHSDPVQRLLGFPTLVDRGQHFTVSPELRVTADAHFCSGHTGGRFGFHGAVTVPAVNTSIPNMMFVAEGDWLGFHDSNFRNVRRANNDGGHSKRSNDQYHRPKNTDAGDCVYTWMKNLRHVR